MYIHTYIYIYVHALIDTHKSISAERAPRSGQTADRRLVERGPEGEAGHVGVPK